MLKKAGMAASFCECPLGGAVSSWGIVLKVGSNGLRVRFTRFFQEAGYLGWPTVLQRQVWKISQAFQLFLRPRNCLNDHGQAPLFLCFGANPVIVQKGCVVGGRVRFQQNNVVVVALTIAE